VIAINTARAKAKRLCFLPLPPMDLATLGENKMITFLIGYGVQADPNADHFPK
jgi:hypothetical protein